MPIVGVAIATCGCVFPGDLSKPFHFDNICLRLAVLQNSTDKKSTLYRQSQNARAQHRQFLPPRTAHMCVTRSFYRKKTSFLILRGPNLLCLRLYKASRHVAAVRSVPIDHQRDCVLGRTDVCTSQASYSERTEPSYPQEANFRDLP